MTLNYGKTEFINFSKPTLCAPDDKWDLMIAGKPIREVNVTKFLGVYIDSNISWRVHISKIITKISQTAFKLSYNVLSVKEGSRKNKRVYEKV